MTTTMKLEEKTLDLKATFTKILEAPGQYADDDDKGACRRLVEALPEDLVEYAANTSYAYWYLASSPDSCPSEEAKIAMAMKEARRHLTYMAGDYDKALANLTESAQYRKDHNLDLLRSCFKPDLPLAEKDEKRAQEMAAQVEDDLEKQIVVMRGHDRGFRSMMIKFARVKEGTVEGPYVLAQIYMADRSTATTEFLSMGTEERSCAVYDYNGFHSKNSPPFSAQVAAATLLQKLFPERLQALVMVEPPFWLRSALMLLSPFLSAGITDRMKMASGEAERTKAFSAFMDPEHSIPLMLPDGKLADGVSLAHYLKDVPYYCLYDDVKCERPADILDAPAPEAVAAPASIAGSLWNSIF